MRPGRQLRAREAGGGRVPIVGLMAAASASDVQQCLDSGMDDVMTEPLKIERMAETIACYLRS